MLFDMVGGSVVIVYVPKNSKNTHVSVLADCKPIRIQQINMGNKKYTAAIYDLSLCTYFVIYRKKWSNHWFYVIKMDPRELEKFRRVVKKMYKYSRIIVNKQLKEELLVHP